MKKTKEDKAITLVALVITIVLLLILSGIAINQLTGDNGLFARAKEAKQKTLDAQNEENGILEDYLSQINEMTIEQVDKVANKVLSTKENTELKDAYGNKIVIPTGFKIVVNEDTKNAITVDKGIVIEDVTDKATKGSQFVWIPVGTIYTSTEHTEVNTKKIKLDRYEFDNSTGVESTYKGQFVEEDNGDKSTTLKNYGNTIAKSITDFKKSVAKHGGFYIGRYEARTTFERKSENDEITQVTERGSTSDYVYNYVTQLQAAKLSQNMYNSTKFTSDLMNSYAWDTAILFLQSFGDNLQYSIKTSVNKEIAQTGTNNQTIKDVECNVYDMSSNIFEWSTETSYSFETASTFRGGALDSWYWTAYRIMDKTSNSAGHIGFRTILYL